jgi:hypothetical protein
MGKTKLTVTCLNALLSAENYNRSPESKKGRLGIGTALVSSVQCCYVRTVCCLRGWC